MSTLTTSAGTGGDPAAETRHFRFVDTPIGTLLLIGGSAGLVRIALANEDHDRVLAGAATEAGPAQPGVGELDQTVLQLTEYFAGQRRTFDLPLDLGAVTAFRRQVLEQARLVPYGHTMSYSELAEMAGNSRAVRAAATACATNPLPVVIPCHRIVPVSGGLGRYLGGEQAKQALLDLEEAA
jgi:methylated-DNA-[protein]-cysteine S-methyltransferase